MKITKDLLRDFVEEKVEPVLGPYLDGELTINYEDAKKSTFIVQVPSLYNLENTLFGEPFHTFGIPKGAVDGMLKVECRYSSCLFFLLFNFTKGKHNGTR